VGTTAVGTNWAKKRRCMNPNPQRGEEVRATSKIARKKKRKKDEMYVKCV
jgi:hypothetical protein